MNVHRRRIVAYIACKLMRPNGQGAIHDIDPPRTTSYTGEISPALIAVYDPDRQDYVLGQQNSPNHIRLTDLASEHAIELNIDACQFEGVDHETGMRFSGNLDQDRIQFFDLADDNTYEYRI